MNEELELLREKKGFICDMDGVIYHGNRLLPGVPEFVDWLQRENKSFLFLTNSSERSPLELQQKLARMGLEIGEEHFYTSALATAKFIASQKPHASAYVIGAPGLVGALYEAGIVMNDVDPDYVIAGETNTYNYQTILKAVDLINKGARLIATNSYYVGKPNPLMMRTGLRLLGVHSHEAAMIGDRMDTDIVAGIETGLDTVLVLSGCTSRQDVENYAYRPHFILDGVGCIPPQA